MTARPPRVVFDCNVLLAALLTAGNAFKALLLVDEKRAELLISPQVLSELTDVLARPKFRRKYPQITPDVASTYLDYIVHRATFIAEVPDVVAFPRDTKDAPYLNLAIGGSASFLVTRDERHLLAFSREQTPEALEFNRCYPNLRIIDPPGFLRSLET